MDTLEKHLLAMQGNRVYFDTNMFIYFLEKDETYFERCLPFFQAVSDGSIIGVSGDLAIAELLVKPLSTQDIFSAGKVRALFDDGFFEALTHNRESLELAAHIRATQKLSMVDAIHLATAIHNNCSHIVTNDEKVAKKAKGIHAIYLEGVA